MTWFTEILQGNAKWAEEVRQEDGEFFSRLATGQSPACLWIGCCDSRTPPTQIAKRMPGDLFVLRNVANLFSESDTSAMTALHYAVKVLEVEHIVVCGHYGCGGVKTAMAGNAEGPVAEWLKPVVELYRKSEKELEKLDDEEERYRHFCEINMQQQVLNLCWSPIIQKAWQSGQALTIHGVMYDVATGRLKDMKLSVKAMEAYV